MQVIFEIYFRILNSCFLKDELNLMLQHQTPFKRSFNWHIETVRDFKILR